MRGNMAKVSESISLEDQRLQMPGRGELDFTRFRSERNTVSGVDRNIHAPRKTRND